MASAVALAVRETQAKEAQAQALQSLAAQMADLNAKLDRVLAMLVAQKPDPSEPAPEPVKRAR